MVEAGLLWYDDDTHKPLALKIAQAAQRYRERVGFEPTTCEMRPELVALKDAADAQAAKQAEQPRRRARRTTATGVAKAATAFPSITLHVAPNVNLLPNCFLVGVEAGETPVRAAVFGADDDEDDVALVAPKQGMRASKRDATTGARKSVKAQTQAGTKTPETPEIPAKAPRVAQAPKAEELPAAATPNAAQAKTQAKTKTPAKVQAKPRKQAIAAITPPSPVVQPKPPAAKTPERKTTRRTKRVDAPTNVAKPVATEVPKPAKAPIPQPATKPAAKRATRPASRLASTSADKPVSVGSAVRAQEQGSRPKQASSAKPVKPTMRATKAQTPIQPVAKQLAPIARASRTKRPQQAASSVNVSLQTPTQPQAHSRLRRRPTQHTKQAQQIQQALPGMEIASAAPVSGKPRRTRSARSTAQSASQPKPQLLFAAPDAPSVETDAPSKSRTLRKQSTTMPKATDGNTATRRRKTA